MIHIPYVELGVSHDTLTFTYNYIEGDTCTVQVE